MAGLNWSLEESRPGSCPLEFMTLANGVAFPEGDVMNGGVIEFVGEVKPPTGFLPSETIDRQGDFADKARNVTVAVAVVDNTVDVERYAVAVALENTYSVPLNQEQPESDQQRHQIEAHDP